MKPLLNKYSALPILVILIGMMATWVTWSVFDRQINQAEQLRFSRYSDRVITTIQERLLDHERLLEGGRGLFYASKSVEFDEWYSYVNTQHLELYPGILGFGYIYPVLRAQLPTFVAEIRKQAPDFTIRSTGDHPDLFVITQIEPVSRNRSAWGFDIGQEANRREAAETAAMSGKATLTRRITLVQDQKKIAGFLMLLPIYQTKSVPLNPIERKRALTGWVYVPIRIEELMSGIVWSSEDMIDFEVVDGESTDKRDLIFDADGHIADNNDTNIREQAFNARMFHRKTPIEVQGRVWTVYTSTRPEFEHTAAHAHWVFPVGLLLSVMAALAMWSLANARRRAEALADSMTLAVREREERWQLAVNGSNAGIWDWNVLTDEVFYSPRWLSLLGLRAHEVSAQHQEWLHRVHGEDLKMVQKSIQAHFQHEAPFYFAEYRIMHGDGSYRWVADTGQAQWDAQDRVVRMVGSMTDITKRKQAEADVRDSESRMHAIVDSVMDAIVVIDSVGRITSFNPAAERIFGYSAQEIQGRNVSNLMPEPYRGEHAGYMRHYLETGEARVMGKVRELTGQRKDGSSFPMELAVTRIVIKGAVMFTGIVRDITERQKVDRMKNEFVSTVSHELRTPLTSIRGSLGLIMGGAMGELPEQMRQLMDIAHSNSERLIRLINDILDIEKIESGKIMVDMQTQALMPLIEQALEANRSYAEQLKVKYQITESLSGVMVNVDTDRFMQIMANLLSNAAKFAPPEGVVSIKVSAQGSRVRVAVSDQGPGIPEAFREKIFQKFTQADASDTRQKGGTGLGLAISKKLVERMSGSIAYTTQLGQGTTFFFDLPVSMVSGQTSKPRILICESDNEMASHIAVLLTQAGYASDIANSVQDAQAMLDERRYEALTLDISAPNQDGLGFFRKIREHVATKDLPVIALAMHSDAESQELKGASVALVDWLQKPIDQVRFLSVVQATVKGASSSRARILHVEDDADIHHIVRTLGGALADFDFVPDLSHAREKLAETHYDLVVLDLSLPDGEGWELLPVLGQQSPPPPVLVFSARELSQQESEQVAAALVKSQTSNETLLQTLKSMIEKSKVA